MARITINNMVKDVFYDATKGQRSIDNFIEGLYIVEHLKYFYYRPYFEEMYAAWQSGERTAKQIMRKFRMDMRERAPFSPSATEMFRALDKFVF